MKSKMLVAALAAAVLTGCATQTAVINGADGPVGKEEMQTFFVSGLGQTQTIDAAAVCGNADKVAKVERTFSPLNWLLGTLTMGIYTPLDAKVHCR
jgi:outer membrane biogenesis lipoprotein LolB